MSKKKRQHYVPKLYMRNFSDTNKRIAVYHLKSKKIISDAPYDNQCYEDYFYGKDLVIETQLGEKEELWSRAIKMAIESQPLTDSDIRLIKEFAVYQRQRTLGETKYHKEERQELITNLWKRKCAANGIPFDSTAEKECMEYANSTVSPSEILNMVNCVLGSIDDLSMLIITYSTKNKLIFSDVPVISINPFHKPSIGYGCMGLIVLFPITPEKLIVIYDSKMYPKYKDILYANIRNENEVRTLNILQFISAEKAVYAHVPNDFPIFSANDWKHRAKNRDSEKATFLGTHDNSIIAISMRKVILNCNLSFGQLRSDVVKIPFMCRQAVSRQYDEEWYNQLKSRVEFLPLIAMDRPDLFRGLTKKEIRRGYKNMADFAKKYWHAN